MPKRTHNLEDKAYYVYILTQIEVYQKKVNRMGNPHVLVVPYPAEGHIIPLLELSQRLVKEGLNVTFVTTEYIYEKVKNIMATNDNIMVHQIHLAVVKDGLSLEDRKRPGKLSEAVLKIMPGKVDDLIEQINGSSAGDHDHDPQISCVVADQSLGWALDIAERKGIKRAAFCPAAAAMLVQGFSIPKLIDEGIINKDGTLAKKQIIKLSPEMPSMNTSNFVWVCLGNADMQANVFQLMVRNNASVKKTGWLICNSTYDLEPAAFKLAPQVLPIGLLLSSNNVVMDVAHPSTSTTCLKWLDQHPPKSVIYIAFGSFTVLDQTQSVELALGLELSNRPFLWVVRTSYEEANHFPKGFLERMAKNTNRGLVVKWAPQQKVLSHPSIGCFVSHCGWNSTVEGVSNGVPFLCWPYFADQFINQSYVCEVWRVGLGFDRDENGVITRDEISKKLERVMGDKEIKGRALELKEMVENSVKEGGNSTKNFKAFVEWLKS